ncbi:MAG: HAMP domain-containing histidine kinase [Gammaproteobacteria bacterium]|nr:HAMP domain-containing histidine kinase [Gammaproteobacteria bacterium]
MIKSDQRDRTSIRRKLTRKGMVQSALVGLFAIIAIGLSSVAFEQFLMRKTLQQEAVFFWQSYRLDPQFTPPQTAYMSGYLSNGKSSTELPGDIQQLGLGFHRIPGQSLHSMVYTTEQDGNRLYLLFNAESIWFLALLFGILPSLMVIMLLIYFAAWWVYRESAKVLRPIIWLSNRLDRFDPTNPGLNISDLGSVPGDVDWEVEKLIASFSSYSERIKKLVLREQAFTRDASHEFRSPLTVIKLASDLLLTDPEIDTYTRKYGSRIKNAARVMEELIDAFLLLARETESKLQNEPVKVADIVESEVEIARTFKQDKQLDIEIVQDYPLELVTVPKVLSIVLGNLIRNSVMYTSEGKVTVRILEGSVIVTDTGIGMTEEKISKTFKPFPHGSENEIAPRKGGVGLTIVKRLADRFGWVVSIESEFGVGTSVTVNFVQA